jgi:hypothetical protein
MNEVNVKKVEWDKRKKNAKKIEGSIVFYKYPCKQVNFNKVE